MRSGIQFLLFGLLTVGAGLSLSADEPGPPKVTLSSPEEPAQAAFEVQGVGQPFIEKISTWKADDPRWLAVLNVYVGKEQNPDQPAMLGTYEPTPDGFRFAPRFPLERGLSYRAVLQFPRDKPLSRVFSLPAAPPTKPAEITAFYPSSDQLPENLLRLYVHFSAPMSQGDSYRYLHLFDEAGEEVRHPFLELPQELWSADGKRLTVLLDPGRVKQGLKPREESGPVLVAGRRYALTIEERWPDAKGRPLAASLTKNFLVTEPDVTQPNPAAWNVLPPAAGTKKPLVVRFPEPLDHGMLQRVLQVVGPEGMAIKGTIKIDQKETRWSLTPDQAWAIGEYQLSVRSNLEDRAGNCIARPFEVDLNEPPPKEVPQFVKRKFQIK